jgi:hypothetical protein
MALQQAEKTTSKNTEKNTGKNDDKIPALAGDYCNALALERGLHPAGHADSFAEDLLLLEAPLPWRRELYQVAGALPQQAIDLYALWLQRYQAGLPYNHRAVLLAPDPHYSQPGYRRVLFYTRPQGAFAEFPLSEYLVPEAEAGALVWALYKDRERLATFERYRRPTTAAGGRARRDILVCTHGTVDVACARFGYPLYRHLRDYYAGDDLRVWRASHFGGHVFAPTLIDLPTGHFWAYVMKPQAQRIVQRSGDVADLAGHLRGWAGLATDYEQAADCALWQREGWAWFDCARQGQILAQTESESGESASGEPVSGEPAAATVRIAYTPPNGAAGAYTAHVAVTHTVVTRHSTAGEGEYGYPQFAVSEIASSGATPHVIA